MRSSRTIWSLALTVLMIGAVPVSAASGDLDPSFSGNGIARVSPGDLAWFAGVDMQGTKPVAAGAARVGGDFNVMLVRFTAQGAPDPTFGGGDGMVRLDVGGYDAFFDVAVLEGGKILAAGVSMSSAPLRRFLVMRFKPDGAVDHRFGGGDGMVFTTFNGMDSSADSLLPLPDGRFVVCGERNPGGDPSAFAIARYTRRGSLDTSFGGDGKVTTQLPGYSVNGCSGIGMGSDGGLVAGGAIRFNGSAPRSVGLAKYKPNGNLDTSFAGDGTFDLQAGQYTDLDDVLVLDGGAILFSGQYQGPGGGKYLGYISKLDASGSFVASFANGGWRDILVPGGDSLLASLALDPSGMIVATGEWSDNDSPYDEHVIVTRLKGGGAFDSSFSGDGIERFRLDPTGDSSGNAVVVQNDGRIIVAGETYDEAAIARLLA
jgi:uncharacterized delta-60 repeat protein